VDSIPKSAWVWVGHRPAGYLSRYNFRQRNHFKLSGPKGQF